MTDAEKQQRMTLLLDFGLALLSSGSEIERVENSIGYLSRAFGAVNTHVFAITATMVLSVDFGDGDTRTQSVRIRKSPDTNFQTLARLNSLCRKACETNMTPDEFRKEFDHCISTTRKWRRFLGAGLTAGAFAVFFGGTPAEAGLAFFIGMLIHILQRKIIPFAPNRVFLLFSMSFLAGAIISPLCHFFPIFNRDIMSISAVMLLVPGMAATTAVRDLVVGDTISGSIKFTESILLTLAMASGLMSSIALWEVLI